MSPPCLWLFVSTEDVKSFKTGHKYLAVQRKKLNIFLKQLLFLTNYTQTGVTIFFSVTDDFFAPVSNYGKQDCVSGTESKVM